MSGRNHRLRAGATVLAVLASLAFAGCGSDEPGVTPSAGRTLHGGVQLVRAAAAAGDREAASSAVDHLERTLAAFHADGRVSDAAVTRIRRAMARVRTDIALIPTTTTTTTTTTTRPPADEKEHGKGRGKGHDD